MNETNAPPPIASPQPPTPAPGDSDVRKLSKREVDRLLKKQADAETAVQKAKNARRILAALVGAVLTTVVSTLATVGWAQNKVDAGVSPVKEEVRRVEVAAAAALAEHKKEEAERFARLEKTVYDSSYRLDLKTDALLLRFGVPNPAPVPARDGGSP